MDTIAQSDESRLVYGVDVGARRVAVVCPQRGWVGRLRAPASTPAAECGQLADFLLEHVPGDAVLWVEAPIVGGSGNAQTALRLAMTVGALISCHGGPTGLVAVSTWKKEVCGHGGSSKSDVRAWLHAQEPTLAEACAGDQDLYDAACVGLYGLAAPTPGLGAARGLPRRTVQHLLRQG